MPVIGTSNLGEALGGFRPAIDAGLRAAGYVVRNDVVKRFVKHHGGYKTGAFATGLSVHSVQVSEPQDMLGGRGVAIGTNVQYARYWELGHVNLFSRKYERAEFFRPAIEETEEQQLAAFVAAAERVLGRRS